MILKLFIFITGLSAALSVNFFRKDYTYDEERDAFYKLMWSEEGNSYDEAVNACDNDGSQLFYPKDHGEWRFINNLVKAMPQTPNTSDVLLGIRDEVGNGEYLTLDGHFVTSNIHQDDLLPLDCVTMDLNTGALHAASCEAETDPRLFVCKKMDSSPCPTVDEGYKYYEDTKKCYKVNPRRKSWKDAMKTCYMEGGLLVVVESDTEAGVIGNLLPEVGETNENFHSGFRKISDKYYTLKGKKIEDSYSKWYNNGHIPTLNCGVISKRYSQYSEGHSLFISSTNCEDHNPFICEIQARF